MIKKGIILTCLVLSQNSIAQVGIDTNTPTRALDINGNLKIREISDESDNGQYTKVLVTNADGNVDYIYKKDLLPATDEFTSNKEVINNIYSNNVQLGIDTKVITCGKFQFSFSSESDSKIRFNLTEKPSENIDIYMSMEQNWTGSGFQFYQGTSSSNTTAFKFTTTDWNTPKEFASANLAEFEQNVMYFQYPKDPSFYRLTIYRVNHTVNKENTWSFVSACEKF